MTQLKICTKRMIERARYRAAHPDKFKAEKARQKARYRAAHPKKTRVAIACAMDGIKECSKCKQALPATSFHKDRHKLRANCRECCNAASRRAYAAKREKLTASPEWRKAKLEKRMKRIASKKASRAAWYANNLERERQKNRDRYKDNAEQVLAQSRAYRKIHPEKSRARMAKRRDQLDDVYVAGTLRQGTILLKPHIPQELIEAKRTHLKLVRKLKKEKQNVG